MIHKWLQQHPKHPKEARRRVTKGGRLVIAGKG
jgi:hypothetical protein